MPYTVHDKSSSLGDPLTEPGEYENLPFHGLQTAPNKVQLLYKSVYLQSIEILKFIRLKYSKEIREYV